MLCIYYYVNFFIFFSGVLNLRGPVTGTPHYLDRISKIYNSALLIGVDDQLLPLFSIRSVRSFTSWLTPVFSDSNAFLPRVSAELPLRIDYSFCWLNNLVFGRRVYWCRDCHCNVLLPQLLKVQFRITLLSAYGDLCIN